VRRAPGRPRQVRARHRARPGHAAADRRGLRDARRRGGPRAAEADRHGRPRPQGPPPRPVRGRRPREPRRAPAVRAVLFMLAADGTLTADKFEGEGAAERARALRAGIEDDWPGALFAVAADDEARQDDADRRMRTLLGVGYGEGG